MKWDLDLWYELWDRAGSQGLDTWHDLRGEARNGPAPVCAPDADSSAIAGAETVFQAKKITSIVLAWLVLPAVVGFRNVLDA